MRAFVGVDVPAPELPGIRPPAPGAPSHLTLLFLGDVPDASVPGLSDAFARAIEGEGPFRLRLHGLGSFPSDERPRILFARIEEGAEALARISERLRGVARERRLRVEDRPFVPHLTVLRIRSPRDAARARELRSEFGGVAFGETRVTELLLKSSVLGGGGPTHRVEARLPLRGSLGVPG